MKYSVINLGHAKSFGSLQPYGMKAYPSLGQTALKAPPKDMTEEQIFKIAGQTIVNSGNKLAAKMNQTYEKYKGTGSWWLQEAAASFFVGGPIGPLYALADLWWQSSRQNEAVISLEASRKLGQEWVNSMTQDETGWLPLYLDGIEKVDPVLASQVGYTFDKVAAEGNRIAALLSGVKSLPPQVVTQFIDTMFSSVKSDLVAAANTLNDLAVMLRNLLGAIADLSKAGRKASEIAPMAVLAAIVIGAAALALN